MNTNPLEAASDYSFHSAPAQHVRVWWVGICLIGLMVYLPTFLSLSLCYTDSESYYAHWMLVPPVSGLLVWMKRGRLRQLPIESCGSGLLLAAASLFVHVLAVWFRVDFISALSLVVTIWGLALYFFGKRVVREIGFPLLFLLFMAPLPGTLITPIGFHMKMLSGQIAVRLYNFLGGTALLTGSKISFSHGEPLWMGYECSGLKSVISLSSLGALVAYLTRLSRPRKVLLFLSSFPLAIFANSIRVTSLCFASSRWGSKSGPFKLVHTISSPVVFMIVLFGLIGIYKLLSIGSRANEPQSDVTPQRPTEPDAQRLLGRPPRKNLRTAFFLLLASSVLVILSPHFPTSTANMSSLEPVRLPEVIGEWTSLGAESVQSEEILSVLNTRSVATKDYRNSDGEEVQVLVVASDTDRQAFHPPEICMIGAGSEVLKRWQETVEIHGDGTTQLKLNAFVRGTRGRPDTLVLYWYMAGARSTGSRTLQQLILLVNGAKKTATIGAMVRLTTSLTATSSEKALRSAIDFIRGLVPIMPEVVRTARRGEN